MDNKTIRVLFLTNYFPPSRHGWGYMQLCEEVADGLHARGHAIAVLTSGRRDGAEPDRPYPVHRWLRIEPDWHSPLPAAWQFFVGRRRRERKAMAGLRHLVTAFHPDVVFIWHGIGLPRVLFQAAEQLDGVTAAYYLAGYLPELPDEYLAYWQASPRRTLARFTKSPMARVALAMLRHEGKPIRLKYEHVICVSAYVRARLVSQGLIPSSSVVIHNGVNLEEFSNQRFGSPPPLTAGLSAIVAGRVDPEKGIHTAIQAMDDLRGRVNANRPVTLTILGDGPQDYLMHLRQMVATSNLHGSISFVAPIARAEMPAMLARHNVLLLPSEYQEPIARSMQEAMAMGLLVVGTTTGGSGELLVHQQTGLVFEPGNAQSMAEQLAWVLRHPDAATALALSGQQTVQAHFGIQHTVAAVEQYLIGLINRR